MTHRKTLLAALFPLLLGMQIQTLPDMPGPIVVGPRGVVVAGDTLIYKVSWGPGARATSYLFTTAVAASNGSWVVVADSNTSGKWITGPGIGPLPATGEITTTSYKTWIAATPWDSATFSITVASKNSVGVSPAVSTSWSVKRKPGPPGPIVVDSSLIVIGTLVLPAPTTLGLGTSRMVCAFKQFQNGAVARWTADRPSCDSIYTSNVPVTIRTVSPAQQAHTDSLAKTCVVWSSATPVAVGVTPNAACSSAVLVTGLAITQRPANPNLFRNVRWNDPVLRVSATGLVTCLHPGPGVVTMTVEGVQWHDTYHCSSAAVPSVLAARQ